MFVWMLIMFVLLMWYRLCCRLVLLIVFGLLVMCCSCCWKVCLLVLFVRIWCCRQWCVMLCNVNWMVLLQVLRLVVQRWWISGVLCLVCNVMFSWCWLVICVMFWVFLLSIMMVGLVCWWSWCLFVCRIWCSSGNVVQLFSRQCSMCLLVNSRMLVWYWLVFCVLILLQW